MTVEPSVGGCDTQEVGDDDYPAALRAILERAAVETRELRHGYIGSEHLLLALFRGAGTRAAQRLEAAGGRYDDVYARIETIVGVGEDEVPEEQILPYTPNAAIIVRRVGDDAGRAGPEAIGTEHVLRAILRLRDSLAVRILKDCGVDIDSMAGQLRSARADE